MTRIPQATFAAALVAAGFGSPATASDTRPRDEQSEWSWALIQNGPTLDAHLARADLARPAELPIFSFIMDTAAPSTDAGS